MSNFGDGTITSGKGRPLNARSLALSVLLGTHPPRLPARSLVSFAQLFDVSAGAMRTALSRMVAAGDVVNDHGIYGLSDRLLARQAAQDAGRRPAPRTWDGTWHTAVATADQRDLADRRIDRSVLDNARFGELRPDIWLRPANLPAPLLGADWLVTTGAPAGTPPDELVARLWQLDAIAADARDLDAALDAASATLDRDDPASVPSAFALSARIVRFLRSEPLLPSDLLPAGWPVSQLRKRYEGFEPILQGMMRPFLHVPTAASAPSAAADREL